VDIEKKWYALYTRPRWEKKLASTLANKNFEYYCPINKVTKMWSDRKKVIQEPLFKGYIFVCLEEHKKWDVKMIDGVINFVYWLGKPAVVKQEEIDTIKKFLNEFEDVEVRELTDIAENEAVLIKQGIFMNYKGMVLEVIANKAKVRIEQMGVMLTATFEKNNLEKV
jgi:transcription antitermination factor NusG